VSFPECIRWTSIEFDPQCGTAQPEDVLRLFIPSRTLHLSSLAAKPLAQDTINTWIELRKFSGATGWPTTVLVLPGRLIHGGDSVVPSAYRLTHGNHA
jgi:E3 ubiquitin-protein ligase MYCBP2